MTALDELFKDIAYLEKTDNLTILEIGTRRWGENPTHHKEWVTKPCTYIMADFMDGKDVDMVFDIHEMSKHIKPESVDIIIACSVFEHLEKPWIASQEIKKCLKPMGSFFVQTHQTFPIHGYPSDFFRYTDNGLKSIFDWADDVVADMEFPCVIFSERCPEIRNCEAHLNSCIFGRKPIDAYLPI